MASSCHCVGCERVSSVRLALLRGWATILVQVAFVIVGSVSAFVCMLAVEIRKSMKHARAIAAAKAELKHRRRSSIVNIVKEQRRQQARLDIAMRFSPVLTTGSEGALCHGCRLRVCVGAIDRGRWFCFEKATMRPVWRIFCPRRLRALSNQRARWTPASASPVVAACSRRSRSASWTIRCSHTCRFVPGVPVSCVPPICCSGCAVHCHPLSYPHHPHPPLVV